jgi:hypothetical protein
MAVITEPRGFWRALGCERRGAVMVEFLIAFIPLFMLFLGIVQFTLMGAAALIVQHAAVVGARAAVVVLDDDPKYYDQLERGEISGPDSQNTDDFRQGLGEQLGAPPDDESDAPNPGGPRMAAVRTAVHARLATIAPDPWIVGSLLPTSTRSVANALGGHPMSRFWFGMGVYAALSTAIGFPVAPGADDLQEERVAQKDTVSVRVTHVFLCLVPLVSNLMCQRPGWQDDGLALRNADDPTQRGLDELRTAPDAGNQRMLVLARVPIRVLRAEATMAAQPAPYLYQSELKQTARKKP